MCESGGFGRSEEGVSPLGTVVMDGCEPLCECWELNLGPLQDQQLLLPHSAISPAPEKY